MKTQWDCEFCGKNSRYYRYKEDDYVCEEHLFTKNKENKIKDFGKFKRIGLKVNDWTEFKRIIKSAKYDEIILLQTRLQTEKKFAYMKKDNVAIKGIKEDGNNKHV